MCPGKPSVGRGRGGTGPHRLCRAPLSSKMGSYFSLPRTPLQAEDPAPCQAHSILASRESQTQTQAWKHRGPCFSGNHNGQSGQEQIAAHEEPYHLNPPRTFPIHPPCPAFSPSAQSWGPSKMRAFPTSESHFGDPVALAPKLRNRLEVDKQGHAGV